MDDLPAATNGLITCKILSLNSSEALKRHSRLKLKKSIDNGAEGLKQYYTKSKTSSNTKHERFRDFEDEEEDEFQSAPPPRIPTQPQSQPQKASPSQSRSTAPAPPPSSSRQLPPKPPQSTNSPTSSSNINQKTVSPSVSAPKGLTPNPNSFGAVDDLLGDDFVNTNNQDDDNLPTTHNSSSPTVTLKKVTPPIPTTNNQGDKNSPTSQPRIITPPRANTQVESPPVSIDEDDMLSFSSEPKEHNASNGNVFSSSPTNNAGIGIEINIPLASREELKAMREQQVTNNVQVALEFKQELDEKQRKESEELEIAKTKHEKSLDVWASNNKEKRNVRTLLTTMHNVLWPNHGWKPIGLGDVLEAKKVKLQYRKAMLVVHPDKVSSSTTEIKFIAKRLFEAINEAYQEFLTKESVE